MELEKYVCDWKLDPDLMKQIETFVIWKRNAIFITKNYDVYGAGFIVKYCIENSTIADKKIDCYEPVKLVSLCGLRIKKIFFGTDRVFLCTEENEVYGYGQQYRSENKTLHVLPQKVSELQGLRVVHIKTGPFGKNLALCNDGKIYLFEFGRQRKHLVNTNMENVKPLSIFYVFNWLHISLLVDEKGIYSIMDDNDLMSNVINEEIIHLQNEIQHGEIKKMISGDSHVLVLDEHGCLFVVGSNKEGQLGLDKSEEHYGNALEHNSFFTEKIVDIAASRFCSLSAALTESGKVYIWGQCRGVSVYKPKLTSLKTLHEVFFHYSVPLVTYKPVNVSELIPGSLKPRIKQTDADAENLLLNTFKKAFDDPKFSDSFVVVEGKTIPVHKSILLLRCEHFANRFPGNWQNENPSVLEIEDGNFEVYKAFLNYLYTDLIDDTLTFNDIIELLSLSNKYDLKPLAERCVVLIQSGITIENVVSVYERVTVMSQATKMKDTSLITVTRSYTKMKDILYRLEESCVKFTIGNETAIVISDEFQKLNAEMAKVFIVKVYKQRSIME